MRRADRLWRPWVAAVAWTIAPAVLAEPGSVRYAPIASNGPALYPAAPGQPGDEQNLPTPALPMNRPTPGGADATR